MFRYVKRMFLGVFRACFLILRPYQARLTNGRVLIYCIYVLLVLFVCVKWSMDHSLSDIQIRFRSLLNEPMSEYHRSELSSRIDNGDECGAITHDNVKSCNGLYVVRSCFCLVKAYLGLLGVPFLRHY